MSFTASALVILAAAFLLDLSGAVGASLNKLRHFDSVAVARVGYSKSIVSSSVDVSKGLPGDRNGARMLFAKSNPRTSAGAKGNPSRDLIANKSVSEQYLGAIATRTLAPAVRSARHTAAVSTSYHDARDNVAGLKLVFANWYVDPAHPAVEVSAGGSCTFSGRIEYPTGMFVDVTFRNGAPTGTAGDGETIVSDWVPIQIPIGKRFKVHVRLKGEGTYRVVYNLSQAHNPEDGMIFGAPSDSVILGDVFAPTGQDAVAPPLAIIGMTSRPSVLIVGDSVEAGSNDDNDNTGLLGPAARLLGSRIAYINVGRGGETSLDFVKGHSKRVALAQHVSHVLIGHGGNDIAAGFASPEITKRLETTASYFAGKTLLTLTEQPRTISSNGWNLDVNQKITQYEGTRQEVQRWKRGSSHPFDIVIDYADAVETAWNSGIWKVGYTDDGVHPTQAGSKAILSTGFDLNRIAPALPGDIEIPAITSSAKFSIAENTTTVATLAASEQGTWSIRGGPDASKFTIDPLTGTLKFANVPDHESPHDKRKNNVYNIDVRFTDHGGLFVGQKISVTVTDMPR